jgi:hypothetical protein
MRSPVTGAVLCSALLSMTAAEARQACKGMPGRKAADVATPPEKLPPPVAMTGIGNGTIAISTSNAEARMWFVQGLNLLHDFWDYESSRAFEQSVRADPNCAMCFWGLYQSESFRGENDAWDEAALKQAEKLASRASPAEKLYIEAG